jgi:tetratricopeptide (TPR) repeat protein
MHNLAFSYAAMGRQDQALKLREEVLARRKIALGEDHPDTLRSMTSVADSYQAMGRNAEALEMYRRTLEIRKAKLGPSHPDTIKSEQHVARSLELLHGPTTAPTRPGTAPSTRE